MLKTLHRTSTSVSYAADCDVIVCSKSAVWTQLLGLDWARSEAALERW
jgi:hypothetical protein